MVSILSILCIPLAAGAAGGGSILSRSRRVLRLTGPQSRARVRGAVGADPVPALGEGDLALFKGGLTPLEITKLLGGYLDRMTACYSESYGFAAQTTKLFERNRTVKEVFISALNPRYDDIAEAARVFEELRALDERRLVKYLHLATAIAVVYDTRDAVATSRYMALWGVDASQFTKLPAHLVVYEYYARPSYRARFAFAPEKLPWPILVHLVDNDLIDKERRWAVSRYNRGTRVAKLYASVPYDDDKKDGKPTKLGDRPYTLANLLAHGGICGDQAHFASRVAKCLGVPAMKVTGQGRYGGSHAWTGYLAIKSGRPILEFTGRYFRDYYYTGDVFDPQTRTMTLDRYVAMMYDGASLSYPKYNKSQMMIRMAEKIMSQAASPKAAALRLAQDGGAEPVEGAAADDLPRPLEARLAEASLELTQEALKLNYFNMWGWPLLMEHVKSGAVPRKDGLKWFNKMLQVLKDHPDMTFACLGDFLECVPGRSGPSKDRTTRPAENAKARQSLYNQASALYAKRPDLQLKLAVAQAGELADAGSKAQALNVLATAIVRNAKEGRLVLSAMRMAVKLATELGMKARAWHALRKADAQFPKKRGGEPSSAYEKFTELLDQLK